MKGIMKKNSTPGKVNLSSIGIRSRLIQEIWLDGYMEAKVYML